MLKRRLRDPIGRTDYGRSYIRCGRRLHDWQPDEREQRRRDDEHDDDEQQ